MISRQKAYKLRELIVKASKSLTDSDALEGLELFDSWAVGVTYDMGKRIRYEGKLYKVNQAHTSQADWLPDTTPALYTEVAKPGEIPVWRQPTGAQDAYMTGDRVWYPDKNTDIWFSDYDNNTWAPDVFGWPKEEA